MIKWHGPQSIADLASRIGVSHEAIRVQLRRLAKHGLVVATRQLRGVGRPIQLWTLTEAGHRQFPDTHADVTVQLIDAIRSTCGDAALEAVIATRDQTIRHDYVEAMQEVQSPRAKVERLAHLRTREGYMAEWAVSDMGFVLIENHCPICAAARSCQGFCRSELDLFRAVLGPHCVVERIEHIVSGARRCAYAVTVNTDSIHPKEHDHGLD
ncbi:MAG: transcriptional regulator [Acidiphilium sp.]|nr:transcriptional regulator [Acidiphilium sp.]MDD4934594.1 transcriptional regulator [Acidiphilium sp.]